MFFIQRIDRLDVALYAGLHIEEFSPERTATFNDGAC